MSDFAGLIPSVRHTTTAPPTCIAGSGRLPSAAMLTFGQRAPAPHRRRPPRRGRASARARCRRPSLAADQPAPQPAPVPPARPDHRRTRHRRAGLRRPAPAGPAPCSGSGPARRCASARQPGLDAAIVTWERDLLAADQMAGVPVDDPAGPARWQLAGEDEDAVISEFTQLAVDCDRHVTPAGGRGGRRAAPPPAGRAAAADRAAGAGDRAGTGQRGEPDLRPVPPRRSRTATRTAAGSRTTPPGSAARCVR